MQQRKKKLNRKEKIMTIRINDVILNDFIEAIEASGFKAKAKPIQWFIYKVIIGDIKIDKDVIDNELKNARL